MYTCGTGLPPAPRPHLLHTHTHILHGSFIKFVFIIDKYFLLPFYNVQLEDRPQAKYFKKTTAMNIKAFREIKW